MCGLIGWINTQRNISTEKYIMEKMTDTLSKRGPDSFGIYSSQHALLGHRRLTVVDPEGGGQPMIKAMGDNIYVIIYNGELYNTDEIRDKLKARGYAFRSYSDTEVLLTAYIEWGEDCVRYFNGIFAFGIWDENHQKLFIARDPLGVKPLFYTQKGSSFIFGSELKALLAHPEVKPIVDSEGILEIFGLGPARTPGNAVFKDVNEVLPGHCLSFVEGKTRVREYWRLESKQHDDDLDTTVDKVRSLFVDAVERQMVSDVPLCTFLSGGLDSSAISVIAANYFKDKGAGPLNTYSIDYLGNDKFFKADSFQPDSDSKYIDIVSNFIESKHHNIMIGSVQLASALKQSVKASDLPGMADIDSSLYLFCKEVSKDATVALSGECADEIFGGYPWFRKPEFINSTTFPWSTAIKERKRLLSKEFSNLPMEEYVNSRYIETLNEVPRLEGETTEEHRMREISYLNIKWFMVTLLNRKDRMSMRNSLEVRVPFADHKIVEYAFNIPWSYKYCDNIEKGLLRRALKGMLPNEVLYRKKSPYPKTHNPEYLKIVQGWLNVILSDPTSPLLQLIDKQEVIEVARTGGVSFGKPWFGQLMKGPQLIAYLIQIDIWLREYKVEIL
jgi:asparagine synthase (glutamine-hydrolysing)